MSVLCRTPAFGFARESAQTKRSSIRRWLGTVVLCGFMISSMAARDGVILLHGLCRTSASMSKMEAALVRARYVVRNVDYPSRTASIQTLSENVIGSALADPQLQACERIHFVTHSLGGILVRSYFGRHSPARLGRVVMLGPPNGGSEVADRLRENWFYQKLNGPVGGELGTESSSTPNSLGPVTFDLGVIAGDRSINWINSTWIAGPDDGKVSVARTKVEGMADWILVHAAHPFLMKDERAIAQTLAFLERGKFDHERDE